jgi:hypothetical protein
MATLAKSTVNATKIRNVLKGTDEVVATTQIVGVATSGALPIYDKDGTLLGYIPLYANSTLT